jgi:hypothetical protein
MYGFVADPTLSPRHNAAIQLSTMPEWLYFSRPSNLAFHNLCVQPSTKVPAPLRALLGLGLNFCIRPRYTSSSQDIQLLRFRREFYVKTFFAGHPPLPPSKLFIASNWMPNNHEIPLDIRIRTNEFIQDVDSLFQRQRAPSNLLPALAATLLTLTTTRDLHVLKTDKNLGPAIIERSEYIRRAFVDHLSDEKTYRQLSKPEALYFIAQIEQRLIHFEDTFFPLNNKSCPLIKSTRTFLHRARAQGKISPFSQFYLLAKIHKSPWKTRPIVSCSGSLLHGLGKWVDGELQRICSLLPLVLRSSATLVSDLLALGILHTSARFFTCDATSMYTNIDTEHALDVISDWLHTSPIPNQANVNINALLAGLRLIMSYNVFCFGDTFWHQLTGTAMGTPPAPMYATLYFYIHESILIPRFQQNLIYYRRYIDDGFGIWIPHPCPILDNIEWNKFVSDFDTFGSLRWEFSNRSTTTTFLDVTISFRHDFSIQTCLFEKALNLYLYLPSHSAHPPGVLKGLIYGTFYRIQRLTSDPAERIDQCRRLFHRLCMRGYSPKTLQPLFEFAVTKTAELQSIVPCTMMPPEPPEQPLFLHVPFHPCDPMADKLQRIFRDRILIPKNQMPLSQICNLDGNTIPISRMIVAYHRPPNLGNLLSPRRFDTLNVSVAKFLTDH